MHQIIFVTAMLNSLSLACAHAHTHVLSVCVWHGNKSSGREVEATYGQGPRHVNVVRIIKADSLPQPQTTPDSSRSEDGDGERKDGKEKVIGRFKGEKRAVEHNVRGQESYKIPPTVSSYLKCHCLFYMSGNT